jgi:hypothetical protein
LSVSIHDLSRVGNPVRFNMPFELGLRARSLMSAADYDVFVLDRHPFRADRTLSDYKGRDLLVHRGTNDGMLGVCSTCSRRRWLPPLKSSAMLQES